MNGVAVIFILGLTPGLIVVSILQQPSFGQDGPTNEQGFVLLVNQDKYYSTDDQIAIYGVVFKTSTTELMQVQVYDPNGNLYLSESLPVEDSGDFSFDLLHPPSSNENKRSLKLEGQYRVIAAYGDKSAETTFTYSSERRNHCEYAGFGFDPKRHSLSIDGKDYNIDYIVFGAELSNIHLDVPRKSMIINLTTTPLNPYENGGCIKLQFGTDLMNVAQNQNYTVLIDGESKDGALEEYHKSSKSTQLMIHFPMETKEIEIQGTWVVPEFGPLTAVLLVLGITAVMILRSRLVSLLTR